MSIFGQKGHTIIVEWLISEQICNPNDILEDLLEQDIIEMMRRKPLPNEWTMYFGWLVNDTTLALVPAFFAC
jgi:hypothetical protein